MEENRTNNVVIGNPEATATRPQQPPYAPYSPAAPHQARPVNTLPPQVGNAVRTEAPQKSMAGLAFNITSMAIGIITFLIGITSLTDAIEYIFDHESWYSFGSELSTSVGCLVFGLLCLAFAFIGVRKKENVGRSMGAVGVICGGLGILCSALSIILLVAYY